MAMSFIRTDAKQYAKLKIFVEIAAWMSSRNLGFRNQVRNGSVNSELQNPNFEYGSGSKTIHTKSFNFEKVMYGKTLQECPFLLFFSLL